MSGHVYKLEYEPEVVEQIRSIPREHQRPVVHRCGELADDPRPYGFEKLDVGFRITFFGYRITYWVDDANRIVTVARVAQETKLLDP